MPISSGTIPPRALHQVLVDEDPGEQRDDDPRNDQQQAHQHDEGERPLRPRSRCRSSAIRLGLAPPLRNSGPGSKASTTPVYARSNSS